MKPYTARLLAALWIAGCSVFVGSPVCHAQPKVTHFSPGALTPGKTVELTLHGTKLSGPLDWWSSFPARVEWTSDPKAKDAEQATCKVMLSPGVAPGIGGIVVASPQGSSDLLYVMVDDLPSAADEGKNHTPAEAQHVSLPVAIDGQSDGTLADYFRFRATAGQRIGCEVVATRLGWDFDAVVRIRGADGKELVLADDDVASGPDPRFVFTAPAAGDFLLEVRDNRFKPGGHYRLRLGDIPLVSTPLPLVVQQGAFTEVEFLGHSGAQNFPLVLAPLRENQLASSLSVSTPRGDRQARGWAALGVTGLPVCRENRDAEQPQAIEPECMVSGVLARPGEQDGYEFTAKKGTLHRFRALTRSLGSAAVLTLQIQDAQAKTLATSAATESDEPVLNFSAPADGNFRLTIEELASRGGVDYAYAVECTTGPQFSLALKNDKTPRIKHFLPAAGAFYLDVQCQRAGYDGPVQLSVDSDRAGWQLINSVIPAKAAEIRLYVQPPPDFATGELAPFWIVGHGQAGGQTLSAKMGTTVQLRTTRPQMPYPPAWHDGLIFLSCRAPTRSFYTATHAESTLNLEPDADQAKLTIEMVRTDEKFKDLPLTIIPIGLPVGVTAEIKRGTPGVKETYDLTLKNLKKLPVGEHAFRYYTYAELSGQGKATMSGDIHLVRAVPEAKPSDDKKPQ